MSFHSKNCPIEGGVFNGIFKYLQNETGIEDISSRNIIDLSMNGKEEENGLMSNILKKESTLKSGYWFNFDQEQTDPPYLQIDFIDNRITLTSWTLYNYWHDFSPNITIYGSNDNKRWDFIDTQGIRKQDLVINQFNTFSFNVMVFLRRRYIKIVQFENRFANDRAFVAHRFELYGIFYSYQDLIKDIKVSCKTISQNILSTFFVTIIFLF